MSFFARLLGEMWRNATANEKAPYVDKELKERAIYKAEIAEWRLSKSRLNLLSTKKIG